MTYRIVIKPSARKEMSRLPADVLRRVDAAILALAEDPRPRGCRKMAGHMDTWRIRVGDYRVVYEVHDNVLIVYVVRVGDRKDVYE